MTGTPLPHRWAPSPNFGERKRGIDMLLLHYTGMESAERAEGWLCNPESGVSCHYLVDEAGGIVQMVSEAARAWHAGASSWEGVTDTNSRSIGIEIHHPGHGAPSPYPEAQMAALIQLARDILGRHGIEPRRVLAHSDVAPERKIDPGEWFDWARLAAEGVGHWVAPAPVRGGRSLQQGDRGEPVAAFKGMLALYGYGIDLTPEFDTQTRGVTQAFQRHFRPERVDGVADESTIDTLMRLLGGLPADP